MVSDDKTKENYDGRFEGVDVINIQEPVAESFGDYAQIGIVKYR